MNLDPEVIRFMGGATGDEEKEREIFHKIFTHYEIDEYQTRLFWGIYQNDVLVGHLQLKDTIYTDPNELEVVYMSHPEARNQGMMTEVLQTLKANQQTWGKRIIATVDKDNYYSLSLLSNWGIEKKETLVDPDDGVEFYKVWLT